jgi:hypothetical protein
MDKFSTSNESAPFKLPEVQPDSKEADQQFESVANSVNEHSTSKAIERNALGNPLSSVSSQSAQPVFIDPMALNDAGSLGQSATSPKKIAVTDDLTANDSDLIEKAWVVKAKAIVEKTKNDPHEQSNEIKKIREDYQSKRFNTNIKIDNE